MYTTTRSSQIASMATFLKLLFYYIVALLQMKPSGGQTCTLATNKVQCMRLQIPSDPLNLAIDDNGAAQPPSATLDGFDPMQWMRFLNAMHTYQCSDGQVRITLRNTVQLARRFYFYDSSPRNQRLDFKQERIHQNSPADEGILHTFTPGPNLDFLTFVSSEQRNTLRISGADIVYSPGRFSWNIFPVPKFDGGRSDGEICGGNARFRRRSLQEQVDQRIQIFRRGSGLDTISIQDPGFRRVTPSELQFNIRSYKFYTGFDSKGRFTFVKAIVLKDPEREDYIAPTIDQETAIAPLCETFRFSRFRRPITYQTVTLKHFDDAVEARRSPFKSANISLPYLPDERWFQVERRNEEFVRLRLAYDLDKYLGMMRVAENKFKFVITQFRQDVASVLSFDFDVKFPDAVPSKQPQLPCMVDSTCQWPGEVKLENRNPNPFQFLPRHPSCQSKSSNRSIYNNYRRQPWRNRLQRQRGKHKYIRHREW